MIFTLLLNIISMIGIYKIIINDYYIYIGQSVNIEGRWSDHLSELRRNKHCNKKLQNTYNKYSNTIKFEILEECDVSELDNKEIYWIGYYRSYGTNHGLNMNLGGDSNRKMLFESEEERQTYIYQRSKKYVQLNKEQIKQYRIKRYNEIKNTEEYKTSRRKCTKKYYQSHKEKIKAISKEQYQNIKKQKGILSKKEKFEKRYHLSRPLTDKEWNTWVTDKSISGSHDKQYAIRYLKSLPNINFTIPLKK